MSEDKSDFFSNFLPEILSRIFDLLSSNDLLSCCQVCKLWNNMASDNLLWFKRCFSKGLTEGQGVQQECNYWKNSFTRQMRHCAKWRGKPPEPPVIVSMHNYAVITDLVIHNDWTACSLDNGTIVVVDTNTQTKKYTFRLCDKGAIWCLVSLSINCEDYLASGGNDGVVRLWQISSGICSAELENTDLQAAVADRSRMVRCLAFTDNGDEGQRLVTGGRYFMVLVWDVVTKTCVHVLEGHAGAIRAVAANRRIVVSASYDKTIIVWCMRTGEKMHSLTEHTDRVYAIHLSAHWLVSSSLDQTMKLWDTATGRCRHTLFGHGSLTKDIVMDRSETVVVSANADSTAKIWSVATGDCTMTLAGQSKHNAALTSVAIVRNTFVVSSSADGYVKLWRLSDGAFIRDILNLEMTGATNAIVWKMVATDTHLICATGSSVATTPSKLYIFNFSIDHSSAISFR